MLQNIANGLVPLDASVLETEKFRANRFQRTTFIKGDLVRVSKRTEVGVCKPGGVARITTAILKRGEELYDVSYILDGTNEKRLSLQILTKHVVFAGRPRRSLQSTESG